MKSLKDLVPRQIRKIALTGMGIGAAVAFLGVALGEVVPMILTGMAVIVVSIVFYLLMYHCPYCGRYLDRSTGDYCPYCSKNVNEEEH